MFLYRGWNLDGKRVTTSELELLDSSKGIDVLIHGFWQVWE